LSTNLIAKDLLIVSATWCKPCVKLKTFIDTNKNNLKFKIEYLDIDQDIELVKKLKVSKVPTSFIFDDDGKLQSKKIGYDSSYYGWLKENEL
jgi:thiol-disulfide isomerase/thioredoxin